MGKKKINEFRLGEEQKVKRSNKVKDMLGADTRISLFQTSMNNAGRNFEGRRVKVGKMAGFATQLYKLALKEIENIGKLSVKQIESTFKKAPAKKKAKPAAIKKLMNKIHKKNGKNKKKAGKKAKGKARKRGKR